MGEAENGEDGYEVIITLNPVVAIIDISMPVMNGMELLKKLNKNMIDTNCIMFSNNIDEEYVNYSMKNGAKAFISKDSHPQVLIDAIFCASKGLKYLNECC